MLQERIKEIRKHFGLSQAQFAQRINMSPGFISNLETGGTGISERAIIKICETFGINHDWIKDGSGQMFTNLASQPAVKKESLGLRIREVRISLGMSQKTFAEKVGYSKNHVNMIENGKKIPSNQFINALSKTANVNERWLLTGEGEMLSSDKKQAHVDTELIQWLNNHPEIIVEIREKMSE